MLLNDYWHAMLNMHYAPALVHGRAWSAFWEVERLQPSASHTFEFLTGTEPIGWHGYSLRADAGNFRAEYFMGGTLTPGTVMAPFNRNGLRQQPNPLARQTHGATVTTPGTNFGSEVVRATDPWTPREFAIFLAPPNTQYYITVTNLDQNARDLQMEIAYILWRP